MTERFRTSRPRIRTLKPELWQDEKVGGVSRDARLLFTVLITLADDEGRFRVSPGIVLGHGYPYDEDAPKKLERWLAELTDVSLIKVYEVNGHRYGWFPSWMRHQRVQRPNESVLPAPQVNGSHP